MKGKHCLLMLILFIVLFSMGACACVNENMSVKPGTSFVNNDGLQTMLMGNY